MQSPPPAIGKLEPFTDKAQQGLYLPSFVLVFQAELPGTPDYKQIGSQLRLISVSDPSGVPVVHREKHGRSRKKRCPLLAKRTPERPTYGAVKPRVSRYLEHLIYRDWKAIEARDLAEVLGCSVLGLWIERLKTHHVVVVEHDNIVG